MREGDSARPVIELRGVARRLEAWFDAGRPDGEEYCDLRVLVEQIEQAEFLEETVGSWFPPLVDAAMASRAGRRSDLTGTTVGNWRLDRLLARGGMGDVYVASRADGQYEQKAALKVVGMALAASEERFLRERQVLANLDHPNIARLIDGGVTPDGTPFLVTELVEGDRIDRHVQSRCLDREATLKLFLQVCAAVENAHQRWVVHSDIKPANVLVTTGERPQVKLLDFGVAHLLSDPVEPVSGSGSSSRRSRAASSSPLTPSFAAPEQMENAAVDQRADVYALGRLLEELLASPASLPRDLQVLLAAALEQDPSSRLPSVTFLAAEIRRHLDGRPLELRSADSWYRWLRGLRRHWMVAALVLLLLGALASGFAWTVHRAQTEERARERAESMVEFLEQSLAPDRLADPQARVGALLGPAIEEAEIRFGDDPELHARVLASVGAMLRRHSEPRLARRALERAVELGSPLLPEQADVVAGSLVELAWASMDLSEPSTTAIAHLDRALAVVRAHRPDSLIEADVLHQLGLFEMRNLPIGHPRRERARAHLERSLELTGRIAGAESLRTLEARLDWSLTFDDLHRRLAELERTLELLRTAAPRGELVLARGLADAALVHESLGNSDAAIRLGREAKELYDRLAPPGSNVRLDVVNNLAGILRDLGRHAEAEPLYRQVLQHRIALNGPDAPVLVYPLYGLGRVEAALEECDRALTHLRRARAVIEHLERPVQKSLIRFTEIQCLAPSRSREWTVAELDGILAVLKRHLRADHLDLRRVGEYRAALTNGPTSLVPGHEGLPAAARPPETSGDG